MTNNTTTTTTITNDNSYYSNSYSYSPLPHSTLYTLKSHPTAGRGIFATQNIKSGTLLLDTLASTATTTSTTSTTTTTSTSSTTTDLELPKVKGKEPLSPLSHVVLRTYRKECCAECFGYDRGREWKVRLSIGMFDHDRDIGVDGGGDGDGGDGDRVGEIAGGNNRSESKGQDTGLLFCSEGCRGEWYGRYGEIGVVAFACVEGVVRKLARGRGGKKNGKERERGGGNGAEIGSGVGEREVNRDDGCREKIEGVTEVENGLSECEIERVWDETAKRGSKIVEARMKEKLTKADRKILKMAEEPEEFDADILYYVLTGVLSAYIAMRVGNDSLPRREDKGQGDSSGLVLNDDGDSTNHSSSTPLPDQMEQIALEASGEQKRGVEVSDANLDSASQEFRLQNLETTANRPRIIQQQPFPLPSLQTLTPSPPSSTYPPHSPLSLHTNTYLHLLTLLPTSLIPYLHPRLTHELTARATHNAFSIRPAGSTDGQESGEFMGWGVWPAASFFNHSCGPNVKKVRSGRGWKFWADDEYRSFRWRPDVKEGSGSGEKTRLQEQRDEDNGDEGVEVEDRGGSKAISLLPTNGAKATVVTSNDEEDGKRINPTGENPAVVRGEELCITYLGGDEKEMDVKQRRKRLQEMWGFWCMCWRCVEEEGSCHTPADKVGRQEM